MDFEISEPAGGKRQKPACPKAIYFVSIGCLRLYRDRREKQGIDCLAWDYRRYRVTFPTLQKKGLGFRGPWTSTVPLHTD